jgi:hypothetical protein
MMRVVSYRGLWLLAVVCSIAVSALGGEKYEGSHLGKGTPEDPYIVPEAVSAIAVDGVLDEEAWESALVLDLPYETWPGENTPAPVRTECLITFDKAFLYIGFRAFDPDPSAIRAHYSNRDNVFGEDYVQIGLDTFNDERRAYMFICNALGVQVDFLMTQSSWGVGWDAIFYSAGKVNKWDYAVEIAIPFNQLQFPRTSGPQVWGFEPMRFCPRLNWSHIHHRRHDRSDNNRFQSYVKIKGFEGINPGLDIEIIPTITATRTDGRDVLPSGQFQKQNQRAEIGVTSKWGITRNLTLSGTFNPDFSQVEADAMQLDINEPFALNYPEKRPFFIEGSDFFGMLKPAVYTRTMREPSWGFKLTGKEGSNTVGAYIVRDDMTNLIFPSSQSSSSTSMAMESTASVLRYKRDLGDRYTVGALFTGRNGEDYLNRLLGVDGHFRITQTDSIQFQVMGSSTKYPTDVASKFHQPLSGFSGGFISFEYDHESRNAGWWFDYEEISDDFRADLGFIPKVGYRNFEGGMSYNWHGGADNWWRSISIGNEINYFDDRNGSLLYRNASLFFRYGGFLQSNLFVQASRLREAFNGVEFDRSEFVINGSIMPNGNLQIGLSSIMGDRIDYANTRIGSRISINLSITAKLSKHFRLGFNHLFERLTVDAGHLYTANISQATATYHFSTRSFFRSIIQYVSYDRSSENYTFPIDPEYRHLFTQFLFSYMINPWTVLFVGYGDDYLGSQNFSLTQTGRTFFVKLGYAWGL